MTDPTSIDIAALNDRHINSIDKLYRMYAGTSSHVLAVGDDHFVLHVQVFDGHSPERRESLIFNITKAWRRNPELEHCRRVHVRVVKSQAPAGLCVDPMLHGGVKSEEFISRFAAQIRAIVAADKLPKILLAEYEGDLPLVEPGDLRRLHAAPES